MWRPGEIRTLNDGDVMTFGGVTPEFEGVREVAVAGGEPADEWLAQAGRLRDDDQPVWSPPHRHYRPRLDAQDELGESKFSHVAFGDDPKRVVGYCTTSLRLVRDADSDAEDWDDEEHHPGAYRLTVGLDAVFVDRDVRRRHYAATLAAALSLMVLDEIEAMDRQAQSLGWDFRLHVTVSSDVETEGGDAFAETVHDSLKHFEEMIEDPADPWLKGLVKFTVEEGNGW